MSRVFTVYHCGTCFDRTHQEELIANLADRTVGSENRDWMITDGPGSGPGAGNKFKGAPANDHARALNNMVKTPGTIDPVTGQQTTAPFAQLRGVVDGFGWDQNVEHCMAVIKALIEGSSTPPQVINMAGWSRGAITCHMLAHALQDDPLTLGLTVNIFAADPVPGPGKLKETQTQLPPNVKRYVAIIQEDESQRIFMPVVITPCANAEADVKHKVISMPGNHCTGVMRLGSEVGLVVAFLAHKFLTKHGTQLRDAVLLSPRDLCELYAKIRLDLKQYRKMRTAFKPGKVMGTFVRPAVALADSLYDNSYFVNQHHLSQFRSVFPMLFQNMTVGNGYQSLVDRELARMQGVAPTTHRSLKELGII